MLPARIDISSHLYINERHFAEFESHNISHSPQNPRFVSRSGLTSVTQRTTRRRSLSRFFLRNPKEEKHFVSLPTRQSEKVFQANRERLDFVGSPASDFSTPSSSTILRTPAWSRKKSRYPVSLRFGEGGIATRGIPVPSAMRDCINRCVGVNDVTSVSPTSSMFSLYFRTIKSHPHTLHRRTMYLDETSTNYKSSTVHI